MAALDTVSIAILLGSLIVLAGILSSVLALRFGAPLLLVFLLIGVLAGESGPGGINFDDVGLAYTVGSLALALILFDGGLRTRLATFRGVLAPAGALATVGVLVTAALVAPVAKFLMGISWTEGLLIGAVVASTDAAAVFFLINSGGLRLRSRISATLEVESGANDPFAIFLTIVLVEILLSGSKPFWELFVALLREGVLGAVIGSGGGRIVAGAQSARLCPGLSATFVAVTAFVLFSLANLDPRLRLSGGLFGRARRRQSENPRPQFGGRLSRRPDLARPDRHVRAARPAGVAGRGFLTARSARS